MNDRFQLDMTMMFAIHDALRRDLKESASMVGRSSGWDLFARMLTVHHTIEDDLLWPVLRDAVAGQADDLALIDEMEREHAVIDPLLEQIEAALARGEMAPEAGAELAARVEEHLTHEEDDALPLIDRSLTLEQWIAFGQGSAQRLGPDMANFLPWVFDGADPERTQAVLGMLPEPVQQMYRDEWQPAYAARDWWVAA